MDYTGRLSGSSLIPFDLIGKTILGFLFLMLLVHLTVNFFRKDLNKKKKRSLTIKIGGGILTLLLFSAMAFGIFWLVPPPHVLRTSPTTGTEKALQNQKIEVVFDRPVSRRSMNKSIKPDIPGIWEFEDPTYNTHLTRKVVFYPQQTLDPDTEYAVNLSGITNTLKWSAPYSFEFSFKTHKTPVVEKVVNEDMKINVHLSEPAEGSYFEFETFPTLAVKTEVDKKGQILSVIPSEKWEPSAHYRLKIYRSNLKRDLFSDEIVEMSVPEIAYEGEFQTKDSIGEGSILPVGSNIGIDDTVAIRFTKQMNKESVERNIVVEPNTKGRLEWADDHLIVFSPDKLDYDTRYVVRVKKEALTKDGSPLSEDIVGSFKTLGRVKVESVTPANGAEGVGVNTPIKLTMDQDVNRLSAQAKFTITPQVKGKFTWLDRTLIFSPTQPLEKNTLYSVTMEKGVQSVKGIESDQGFVAAFSTTQSTYKLSVPAYLQQHSLSCEAASLRMALAYRGIAVTEDELLNKIGFDPTPKKADVWGNPYKAFVGDVNGKQMTSGYGVYWGPVARVAAIYTGAKEFTGRKLEQLLTELQKGNPVIVWGYSGSGRNVYWKTNEGEQIHAVGGEHTFVVTGFVGRVDNPSRIIVNDSLVGQVYMTRANFEKKWSALGRSGVVIF